MRYYKIFRFNSQDFKYFTNFQIFLNFFLFKSNVRFLMKLLIFDRAFVSFQLKLRFLTHILF